MNIYILYARDSDRYEKDFDFCGCGYGGCYAACAGNGVGAMAWHDA